MKTFLDGKQPLVAMIQCRRADECIRKIKDSLADGAEAFGVQLCQLAREERSKDNLKAIFAACGDKPIYITSYRYNESTGMTDEECADLLLQGLECGATLCDIPGDLYDKNAYQITDNESAVEKQKVLIDRIRQNGGEVLISTHNFRDLSGEEIFRVAKAQAAHGADILKIVVKSESENRLSDYIRVIRQIKEETGKPVLLLDIGACSALMRKVGPLFGTCMYLCVQSHGELDTPAQPLLRDVKTIREALCH